MHPFDDAETISLEVIDATLAGEAVEPEYADLAELTLILAGQRPVPSPTFATSLDDRVARRFAPSASSADRRPRRWWLYAPGAAAAAAAVAAVVIVVSAGSTLSSSGSSSSASSAAPAATGLLAPSEKRSSSAASQAASKGTVGAAASGPASSASSSGSAASNSGSAPNAAPSASSLAAVPSPVAPGRQVIQSAQLALSTRPNKVDSVAQQVFDVVQNQGGVVENSNVTAANNASGYAQFELSVPSAGLSQTMSQLSQLHGASVVSRTDATQDVTGQVGAAGRALADARALRTSLLRQLESATTTQQIDSLKIQIRDAEASISSDEATLAKLHHQVDNSQIYLTINAATPVPHPVTGSGSFTLPKAAHDAGRVLVVAAGVALIALAVLVPLSMVAAVVLWLAYAIRRRRREQALDLV